MSVYRTFLAVTCVIFLSACATARPTPQLVLTDELTSHLLDSAAVYVQVNAPGGQGHGSGVIISKDGYVLTCERMVRQVGRMNTVTTVYHGRRTFPAAIVATDPRRDLALLKIDSTFKQAAELEELPSGATNKSVYGLTSPMTGMHMIMIGVIDLYPFWVDTRPTEPADFKNGILSTMPGDDGMSGTGIFSAATGKLVGIHKMNFRTQDDEKTVIISTKEIKQFLKESALDLK